MEKCRELVKYHCVLDEQMIGDLAGLCRNKSGKEFSGMIVKVLYLFYPAINNEHFFGKQRNSRYERVCEDPTLKRNHI